jgi:hypothetical protein
VAEKISARPGAAARRTSTTAYAGPQPWLVMAVAWFIPGAGHLWLGRRQKGLIFLIVLPLMFAFGLLLKGRLFPFAPAEPLVFLAAVADVGVGLPNVVARALGYGAGEVTAITWEYGNTFTIVAGLLNMLVVLDVFDVTEGRK